MLRQYEAPAIALDGLLRRGYLASSRAGPLQLTNQACVLIIFGESAASRFQIVVNKNARTGGPCGQPYFYSLETEGASFTSETTQCKLFAPDVGLELGELVHLTVILLHLSPMAFASYAVMPRKVIFSGRRAASRTGC